MIEFLKRIKRSTARIIKYGGFTYQCPFCGFCARKFTTSGTTPGQPTIDKYQIVPMGQRENYGCPRCLASDKERLVWAYLTHSYPHQKNLLSGKILHIAPERQTRKAIEKIPGIVYEMGDLFFGDERYADGRYDGVDNMDVTNLPQEDNTFDLIICNHVLEHVPDDGKAMRELYRVLKPGGTAILQVPISLNHPYTIEDPSVDTDEGRLVAFGQKDHVRIYGYNEYPERLRKAGFSVLSLFSSFGDPSWAINPRERLFVARA